MTYRHTGADAGGIAGNLVLGRGFPRAHSTREEEPAGVKPEAEGDVTDGKHDREGRPTLQGTCLRILESYVVSALLP